MLNNFKSNLIKLLQSTDRDKVTVYAAQASYFVIMSVIPFICLLISVVSFLIPTDIYTILDAYTIPEEIKGVLTNILDQLFATQKVSLLSLSAVFALWAASRGNDAIRVGLENVYHEKSTMGAKQQLKTIISTIILIVIIIGNIALALFGDFILNKLHLSKFVDGIVYSSIPILCVFMCIAFNIMYAFVGKGGKKWNFARIKLHFPGAVFATAGWMIFTYGFSLYIRFFPSASAIYGSFTAICLIMLWLYICMIILLLGAEVNKLIMRNKGEKVGSQ